MDRPVRIDFAWVLIAGNRTRYLSLRPVIDREPTIRPRWLTMRTYEDDATRWTWIPAFLRPRVRNLGNLLQLVFSRADVLVLHAFETYLHYAPLHRLLRRKRLLVTYYDGSYKADGSMEFGDGIPDATPGFTGRLRQLALDQTALFIPWSHFTAERTRRAYPPAADRIVVIHPGIDLESWPQREPPAPRDRLTILFVGADGPRKGLDTLLDALDLGTVGPWQLDVVTSAADLPAALGERLDRTSHVRVHHGLTAGSAPLRQLFNDADVFVLPTRLDLSPLATVEAMATGVPVVSSDVGGLPEMVIDGVTGLTVPRDDPSALAAALERLRADEPFRRRLAEAGRARAEEHFDSRKNGVALLTAIKQALAGEPAVSMVSVPPPPLDR